MLRTLAFLLFLCAPGWHDARAQAPLYETRAVWFTQWLDDGRWPPRNEDAEGQAEALREIIRGCKARGLNTFVFQVSSNGDALYPSRRLPWGPGLQGPGLDPGFDPLAVAIDEAHRLGMELHAWINVFWVGDLSTLTLFRHVQQPSHVVFAHPEWVRASGYMLWIDPAIDAAQAWLLGNVVELVESYDVDAVHFDYVRYPLGGLKGDEDGFRADPRGFTDIDAWRRDNVSRFVRAAAEAVRARKPWVRVAATPIGNYRPTLDWPAMWGYDDVFQESRRWLQEGWVDYLAPQLYWSLGTAPETGDALPSPDFDVLAREWEAESGGRPVFAGIAAYKPAFGLFPADDLPRQIDAARAAGLEGQFFFRYDHFLRYADLIGERYPEPALPVPLPHHPSASAPTTPSDFALTPSADGTVTLSWAPARASVDDPLRGYAVFRRAGASPVPERAEDLYAVVDATTTSFRDEHPGTSDVAYHYRVVALSRLGMASGVTDSRSSSMAGVATETAPAPAFRLEALYPNPTAGPVHVVYETAAATHVRIALYDLLGREVAVVQDAWQPSGRHQATFDGSALPGGVYLCTLQSGAHRVVERLVVR